MPRALYLGLAIVAAFPLRLAAAPAAVEDVPVVPQVMELADGLGMDVSRDRARFMAEITRLLYSTSDKPPELTTRRNDAAPTSIRVPVPLPAAIWSRAVFRHTVGPDQLIAAILSDRRAALLCRGLAGVDDETLEYLADHPAIVTFLYERAAPVFAVFGESLTIRGGRVVPPGGESAGPLWEAVVRAPLSAPDLFVRLLFTEDQGRLAYLYETIAAAEPRAAGFALGLWIPDEAQRIVRFQALVDACTRSYHEWHPEEHPFTRPLGDLAVLLLRIRLQASGAPAAPAGREFWAEAFGVDPNQSSIGAAAGSIDAAWLVGATGETDMFSRTELLDQFAFGQRVFSAVTDETSAPAAAVVRGFREYRALLLTLDRMDIRSVSTYAAAVQRAEAVVSGDANLRFWTVSQFQGALALLARMRRVGTLGVREGEALVQSLCAVPLSDGEYAGAMAQWVRADLVRALPRDGTWEDRAIFVMAGPDDKERQPRLSWEGQEYRLDLAGAERRRLAVVREKQAGQTIDLALAIDALGRRLHTSSPSVDGAHSVAKDVQALADESAARLRHPSVNLLPPGVNLLRDGFDWLSGAADDLARMTRPSDLRRIPRVSASLERLADVALGNALLSFAYAGEIGDPEGAALLTANVSLRHDFGLARKDTDSRARAPWAIPRQDFQPGVPWHLAGSALGIDIALAPLSLRRLSIDRVADTPKMSSIERESLTLSVGLMDPARLKDTDRDAIVAAINRGRSRVQAMRTGGTLNDVAETLAFDGWRRRSVAWILQNEPQTLMAQFSLADMLNLGGGAAGADLDAWGAPALYSRGCSCLAFPGARWWRVLEGRPQQPMMAATMGDLNLAVAIQLGELKLPAALARAVLSVALADFIDETSMQNSNDWWAMSRQAQSLRRQRFEDYVSAAAAVDGPLVPEGLDSPDEPR